MDVKIATPDGEIVGVPEDESGLIKLKNEYCEVSTDSANSYGPEAIHIKRFVDRDMKHKVGATFKVKITWFKD